MDSQISFPPYQVSLDSFKFPGHSIPLDTSTPQFHDASVLHINNYGEFSFINYAYVKALYAAKFGPDAVMPEFDTGTQVQLRSRLGDTDETRVTTHRILYTARYDVMFRKDDWEVPVQECVLRLLSKQQQQQQQPRKRRRRSGRIHKRVGS